MSMVLEALRDKDTKLMLAYAVGAVAITAASAAAAYALPHMYRSKQNRDRIMNPLTNSGDVEQSTSVTPS